ncbi:MAG TPA: hypothetical protein VME20_02270 [Acidimicrobiales bacterium]|nr:hypothetical protein [Acidimicrobiales bacterium]
MTEINRLQEHCKRAFWARFAQPSYRTVAERTLIGIGNGGCEPENQAGEQH